MNLILYSVTDSDNVINKTLGIGYEMPINLKSNTNIIRPDLVLATVADINFQSFNYAYIDVLSRYYFITGVEAVNNVLWRLSLECDVIETYKSDILNSVARFKRNIRTGDYINTQIDSSVTKSITKYDGTYTLPDVESFILTTVGV